MTFRGILGGLGSIFKWGIVTFGMIAVLLLAINAMDEKPSPELKALQALPQINADPSNGYFALAGINAPAEEDSFNFGAQWVDTYNAAADMPALKQANARFSVISNLTFLGGQKHLCNPSKTPCLPQAKERAATWRKLAADNEILLTRHRALTAYANFEESYFPSSNESPLPSYASPSRLLMLDLIALDAAEGRLESALSSLEALMAFDRRALLGSRHLITGMVARSWLGQDYALLSEIVASRPKALADQQERLERMTEPLEIGQVRAVAARLVEGEYRYVSLAVPMFLDAEYGWQDAGVLGAALVRPFFKPRATMNLVANYHAALQAQIRDFSPENSDAWIARLRQLEQDENNAVYSWRILYNPVGKIGLAVGRPEYHAYILRLSDLIGVIRLARLQVDIVTAEDEDEDIPALIAANKALYDPYTDKPMGWDASKRYLYFDAHSKYSKEVSNRIQAGI